MEENYSYILSNLAIKDIDETLSSIKEELKNQKSSEELFSKINDIINHIRIFPYSYPTSEYYHINEITIRHAIIDNFCLFYEIDCLHKRIVFLRFRYAKIDFKNMKINNKSI